MCPLLLSLFIRSRIDVHEEFDVGTHRRRSADKTPKDPVKTPVHGQVKVGRVRSHVYGDQGGIEFEKD